MADIFEGFLKKKITCTVFVTIVLRLIEKRFIMFKKEKRAIKLLIALLDVKYSSFYTYCNNKNTNKDV